jgi:hypothetical protein
MALTEESSSYNEGTNILDMWVVDQNKCNVKIQAGLVRFGILSRVRNLPNTVMHLRAVSDSGNL